MRTCFRYILFCFVVLICGFNTTAQNSMPDNICVGVLKHYYVDPNSVAGSTYVWRIDGIIQSSSTANAIDITWANAGTFLLNVQERSLQGCLGLVRTGIVNVNTVPIIVATSNSPVCEGSSIFLKTQTASGDLFFWTGPNGYSSTDQNAEILSASPSDAGTYTLIVSNNGCSSISSSVIIAINNCDIVNFNIPEGFSPNADGINDLFVIRGIGRYPNNKIVFFNRWGDKVFEANPYKNTWDGKATKGFRIGADELPIGTYFYVLDLGDGSPVFKNYLSE